MATTSYFLDHGLYNSLRKSINGVAINNLQNDIRKSVKIPSSNIMLRLTPFTIMEALGLIIPIPEIKLPTKGFNDPKTIIGFLYNEVESYYQSKIDINNLLDRAAENSKFTSLKTKELEYKCVFQPLSDKSFKYQFVKSLTWDFLFKFPYKRTFEYQIMNEIFVPSFFLTMLSNISKFRLAKKFWDSSFQDLKKINSHQVELIQKINTSLELKYRKDYLDCELIHVATIGDFITDIYRPAVVFSCDKSQIIVDRIMTYKTIINEIFNNCEEAAKIEYLSKARLWNQGIVVFCNTDGTIRGYIEVKEIKPFWGFNTLF